MWSKINVIFYEPTFENARANDTGRARILELRSIFDRKHDKTVRSRSSQCGGMTPHRPSI